MSKVITYNFGDNFVKNLAQHLVENHLSDDNDLSGVVCVFGGKRPGLFLRRELARIIKGPFLPPKVFSIDDFVDQILPDKDCLGQLKDLDAC